MLPGFLESTYKRYKNDTSRFLQWLTENGQKCMPSTSTPVEFQKETASSTKTARLKGKARKEAKKAASTVSSSTAPKDTQSERRLIVLKELLPLAKAIAASKKPSITIPTEIVQAGLRAVSARKRCTAYFTSFESDDAKLSQSNHGHSYFISLMEEIILILQPCFAVSAGNSSAKGEIQEQPHTFEELENCFASLEVEEPSEEYQESPIAQTVGPVYDVVPSKSDEDIESEKLFALFCLFDDFQRLRTFVLDLWIGYAAEKTDLITTAVTTDAAFQLAIRTQEEILAAHPECGNYQEVISSLMNLYSARTHEELEEKVDEGLVHWMFTAAHQLLDSFCGVLVPNEVPLMKRGHFGIYDPKVDRMKMSSAERHHEDLILLLELLPEFAFIQRYNISLFVADALTQGLLKMVETKRIPIWLTFATTTFLDIHHLLRDKVEVAFDNLQDVAQYAKSTLDLHFKFSRDIPAPLTWPENNEKMLRKFAEDIDETVLKDVILPGKVKYYKKFEQATPGESERFYLYKRQPILCGMLAFHTILEMQNVGVNICNSWGTVIYPAQFYYAIKQQGYHSWPMMDQAIAIHTEERLFLGSAPKSIEESFKQVSLILGYSTSLFAQNRRRKGPAPVSKSGPRGLKSTTVLCDFLQAGQADNSATMVLNVHVVEGLLNEEAMNAELAANPVNKALKRQWATTKRLSPIQLLEALKRFVPIELQKIRFDYFNLHKQSIELLRRLRKELDGDLIKYFGPQYLDNESQLPFVGLYVIMVSFRSSKVAETLKIDAAGSAILEKAGKVFDEFMNEKEHL